MNFPSVSSCCYVRLLTFLGTRRKAKDGRRGSTSVWQHDSGGGESIVFKETAAFFADIPISYVGGRSRTKWRKNWLGTAGRCRGNKGTKDHPIHDKIWARKSARNAGASNKVAFSFDSKRQKKCLLVIFSMNAPIMVELEGETDPLEIAMKELRERKIPIIIRRYLPDGSAEDWSLDELVIEWKWIFSLPLFLLRPLLRFCNDEILQVKWSWSSLFK